MMEKVLITGVAGELGYELCNAFINQDIEVYGIDHANRSENDRFELLGRNALFHYYNQSLDTIDWSSFEKVDVIYHLAQSPPYTNQVSELQKMTKRHQQNMKKIVDYAFKKQIMVILLSTIEVYGCKQRQFSEDTKPVPASLYGTLMLAEETFLIEMAEENQVDYRILRIPAVSGVTHPVESQCYIIDQREQAGISSQIKEFNASFTLSLNELVKACIQEGSSKRNQNIRNVIEPNPHNI